MRKEQLRLTMQDLTKNFATFQECITGLTEIARLYKEHYDNAPALPSQVFSQLVIDKYNEHLLLYNENETSLNKMYSNDIIRLEQALEYLRDCMPENVDFFITLGSIVYRLRMWREPSSGARRFSVKSDCSYECYKTTALDIYKSLKERLEQWH